MVELALGHAVERLDGLLQRNRRTRLTGELLGRHHVLRQEPLDAPRPLHQLLVLFGQLVDTEDRDDVLKVLVPLQDSDDFLGHAVVLVTDDARVEDGRARGQRVHRGEDALGEHRTRQLGGGIQVREGRRRRRVGVVVGGHVDRLHGRNRLASRRGDALLQFAHLVGQRGLVADRRGHTTEQRRHLRTGLGEPEDVVDEQQHVLAGLVTEPLGHGQRGKRHSHTGTGRLVHLTEHQRGVLEHVGLLQFDPEVVALAGALPHPGEHRRTTEVTGDAVDHLLDEHRLADTRTTEQRDLATTHVRGEQVDDLEAGFEHLGARLELFERRRLAVNRPVLEVFSVARLVEAVPQGVEDVALDLLADGHRDGTTRVGHLDPTHQAVGGLQRDGAHQVVPEVLGDLEREGLRQFLERDLRVERVEQFRHGTAGELDVDDGPGDPYHPAAGVALGRLRGLLVGCCRSRHNFFRFLVVLPSGRRRARLRHRRFR
ncbi:cellobiose phosphorylase [Mycobacterium sp. H4Y]|nr:cellobiose phosphorylase [Mycobacterium sp. MOTT36Y]ELR84223.1 cellobiose phosphorylase [Mycobacterium sp. H4Y]